MKDQEIKEVNEIADVLIDNKGEMLIEVAIALYNAGYRKQEWISVENGLPEDGNYITYTNANGKDNGVVAQKLVTTNIRGKTVRRWEWMGRVSPWIVTHYMQLPEPPKMKGGAE